MSGGIPTVEIYQLIDPITGEVRYVGKAVCAVARLKSHILDARRRNTPVCNWISALLREGYRPSIRVINVCRADQWQEIEVSAIAYARTIFPGLLNIAPGGDIPSANPSKKAERALDEMKRRLGRLSSLEMDDLEEFADNCENTGQTTHAMRRQLAIAALAVSGRFERWALTPPSPNDARAALSGS